MRQQVGIAVVAGGLGFLLGSVRTGRDAAPEPVVEAVEVDAPRPARPAVPATPVDVAPTSAAPPSIADCTQKLGCDCPPPPPADLDPRYGEAAIAAWLEAVEADCPLLREREQILDCSTFPCLVGVALGASDETTMDDHAGFVTCGASGDEDAPEMVFIGNTGRPGDFFLSFAVRPKDVRDYRKSEITRAMTFTSD